MTFDSSKFFDTLEDSYGKMTLWEWMRESMEQQMKEDRVITEYEFRLDCLCPVAPNIRDEYVVTVRAARMIKVEDLLPMARDAATAPIYQEELTSALAVIFGAEVTTVGIHSGVKTTCTST